MLIFTRRVGEVVRIGDDIVLTVLGINGNQAKLGFLAPKEVVIHRKEIYDRIKNEGEIKKPHLTLIKNIEPPKVILKQKRKLKG